MHTDYSTCNRCAAPAMPRVQTESGQVRQPSTTQTLHRYKGHTFHFILISRQCPEYFSMKPFVENHVPKGCNPNKRSQFVFPSYLNIKSQCGTGHALETKPSYSFQPGRKGIVIKPAPLLHTRRSLYSVLHTAG